LNHFGHVQPIELFRRAHQQIVGRAACLSPPQVLGPVLAHSAGAQVELAGIVVLDFGQVYQGPYATLLMAKAGADVIKIGPLQGEPLRRRARARPSRSRCSIRASAPSP
jgi:hypothetical protein